VVLTSPDGTQVSHAGPVLLLAAGKAAAAMASRAAVVLGPALVRGVVVLPHGAPSAALPAGVDILRAAHPVPDAGSRAAAERLLAEAAAAESGTLILALLGGGASALLAAPAEGLSLGDKQEVTAALLASGASIHEVNTVRRACSRVKGGGLRRAAAGAAGLWTLLLSDVVGDDPVTIASGPTVPNPSGADDALAVLARHGLAERVPAITRRLETMRAGPAPAASRFGAAGTPVVVVGGNRTAVDAAAQAARARGYDVDVVAEPIAGDAASAGRALARRLRAGERGKRRALVAGGEPTVRVVPGGRGGRAQHLALAAATEVQGTSAVLLAAGTDGVDGPTDAAGACVDGGTVDRAAALGMDIDAALAATNTHPLLERLQALVHTGPTGTNVTDLVVALRTAW
jgi:glycerate-2-kinase